MGLDELHLRVLATSSEDLEQRRNAQKGMDEIINGFFPFIFIDFLINKKSIAAYAEGKTLGPGGASEPHASGAVIIHDIYSKVLLLGNVVSMCVLDARNQNL